MEKEDVIEINRLFTVFIDTVNSMLNNDFYTDVQSLLEVKKVIENWYDDFKKNNSLTTISIEDLKLLDLEVTELFSKYIETEPVSHNYSEVLSYYLSNIKRYWKDEMEKGRKSNVG